MSAAMVTRTRITMRPDGNFGMELQITEAVGLPVVLTRKAAVELLGNLFALLAPKKTSSAQKPFIDVHRAPSASD